MFNIAGALLSLPLVGSLVLGATTPPPGAITVGAGGKYATLSAALNDTSSNVYFVYAGNYTDKVRVSRKNVRIYGQASNALTYTTNTATISNNIPASIAGSNDLSATVGVSATNVSIYNLNIENTYGHPVSQSQAIALSVQATHFGCYGCQLSGWQDTLLANKGAQFYSQSLIEGEVDFIFGQTSSIWVTKSVLSSRGATSYVTASGRASNDTNYYVFDSCTVQGTAQTYLGRPWRNWARVIFQSTYLGSNVKSVGWSTWSTSAPNTEFVTYAEYNNSGPGSAGPRANFSTQLTSPISILTVLNETNWIDAAYI